MKKTLKSINFTFTNHEMMEDTDGLVY